MYVLQYALDRGASKLRVLANVQAGFYGGTSRSQSLRTSERVWLAKSQSSRGIKFSDLPLKVSSRESTDCKPPKV